MKTDNLKKILSDLYKLYPELKDHKEELESLALKMIEGRPEVRLDESFVVNLREKVLTSVALSKKKSNKFNINFMNKKIFIAAGSLVVVSILFIVLVGIYAPDKKIDTVWNIASLISNKDKDLVVAELSPESFGSLRTLSYAPDCEATREVESMPEGGARALMTASDLSLDSMASPSSSEIGHIGIMPYYGTKYTYVGEDFNLDEIEALTYRQIKNKDDLGKDLARDLRSFNFPGISLKNFNNLKVSSLSFVEDADRGLMINFEIKDGGISIYENWERWIVPEMDGCGIDGVCLDQYRIKLSDMPSDETAISLANEFIAKHSINVSNYGEPLIDNNWLSYYEASSDKSDYYFPSQLSVIYPLLIEGNKVRDQNGYYVGLSVSIDIRESRVSGLHGLMPYSFESSAYELVRDEERVISLAKEGGYASTYYGSSDDDTPRTKLDTPEFSYVKMWRQGDKGYEDILVPALMFPTIREAGEPYYGVDYVVIPLALELIEELEEQKSPSPIMRQGGADGVDIGVMPSVDPEETISHVNVE